MSDTPRTDEQINGKPCTRFEILTGDCLRNAAVPSEFARQLERELNTANERISKLYDYVAALETGGDLMANELSFGYDVDLWNKARGEAKP
jgi:hypothetical protein